VSGVIDLTNARPLSIEQIARGLGAGCEKPNGRGGWSTLCPAHEMDGGRHEPSLDIDERNGRQLFKCRAGCSQQVVVAELKVRGLWSDGADRRREARTLRRSGLTLSEFASAFRLPIEFLLEHHVRDSQGEFGPVVEFHYCLENGEPAPRYRIRYALKGKKRFCFNSSIGEVTAYGLDRLHLALKGALLVVEGESDTLCAWLHGINALGIPGASMTKTLPAEKLIGISTIILSQEPGRDGQNFRNQILTRLQFAGWRGEARIIAWPGEGLKDLADLHVSCVSAPGTFESKLSALIADAEVIEFRRKTQIVIDAKSDNLPLVTSQCWEAIRNINEPPYLFRHARELVRVEPNDEDEGVHLRTIDERIMRHELARAASWLGKNFTVGKPHTDHVRDVLASPHPPLPVLRRITSVPIFLADGTLITMPGFTDGVLYCPPTGFTLPSIPTHPSAEDLKTALSRIDELLHDFPFEDQDKGSDRAHAIALLLLPFLREMIPGCTPLHRVEAPAAGSGKSLLVALLLYPATAGNFADLTDPSNDEEVRKTISTALRGGYTAIFFDNVKHALTFPSLESALTKPIWHDRLLGTNQEIVIPINCAWALSANNPVLDRETLRRSVRIRINAHMEHPEKRDPKDFKYPDIRTWVKEHRAALVCSALTLVQNWIAQGQKKPAVKALGSFEAWTQVAGGVLECAGVTGFLDSTIDDSSVVDPESAAWAELVTKWAAKFATAEVGTSDLFPLAKQIDGIDLGTSGNERSERTRFGVALGRMRDKIIGDYQITPANDQHHAARWKLVKLATNK
jgi:hypothetical protein